MNTTILKDTVRRLLRNDYGVDMIPTNGESLWSQPLQQFLNTVGFDSLDEVELIMAIEDELNVEISDELIEKSRTTHKDVTVEEFLDNLVGGL